MIESCVLSVEQLRILLIVPALNHKGELAPPLIVQLDLFCRFLLRLFDLFLIQLQYLLQLNDLD